MGKTVAEETPLMQQHKAIKDKFPDAILLFRVGDFYETFGQDAVTASRVLGIVLTRRANGSATFVELAGFPYHALDGYLHKLVGAGFRVAVCDQLEDPKAAKGIVKRGVTEMITPGTTLNDKLLDGKSNNFLAALSFGENVAGMAFLDLSTGEFIVAEGPWEYADKLLQSFLPSEVIFSKTHQKEFRQRFGQKFYTYALEDWIFTDAYTTELLLRQFETHSLKGFGVSDMKWALVAAGAVLHYLKDTEHPQMQHIRSIQALGQEDFLWMDRCTIRNLELLAPATPDGTSLLQIMDKTVTPMGGRMLRRWMSFPLKDLTPINGRLDATELFIRDQELTLSLVHHLKQVGDLERLAGKISRCRISPREIVQLARGLQQVQEIGQRCSAVESDLIKDILGRLDPCCAQRNRITAEIEPEPPAVSTKGQLIRPGVNAELDELRRVSGDARGHLAHIQQKEALATGIPSLKISFNNIFGYYLEVTNAHKEKVPASWIRKQTLTSAERYITPELKEFEEKIAGAEDKILVLEQQLFDQLVTDLKTILDPLQADGHALATLDCLICFAGIATQFAYRRPSVNNGLGLSIREGRHPVIERLLPAGEGYIPNDIDLDPAGQQIIILTGPNMSGKSALLRQVGLITLMAHMGSFVPALSAEIGLTDKIFTRVGASDNLSAGESTFMVEMNEAAGIINNISGRSLVLLDEIGRGTSTFDGISIAWSIVEYLHQAKTRPKTVFATHYHELNELEAVLSRVRNFHITHRETGKQVIFLRKLEPGGSRHSFGIQVARMAGMPQSLLDKANEVLALLEEKNHHDPPPDLTKKIRSGDLQLSIFDAHTEAFEKIRKLLEETDPDRITPVDALIRLQEIKNILR